LGNSIIAGILDLAILYGMFENTLSIHDVLVVSISFNILRKFGSCFATPAEQAASFCKLQR
jgi:hypothetical protein